MDNAYVWCPVCGVRLTYEEVVAHGQPNCPKCGNTGVPCKPSEDVRLVMNWHELRILTIWAMNYANSRGEEGISSRQVVAAICRRLEKQYPDFTPLTMAGEFRELRDHFSNVEVHGAPDFDEMFETHGPGALVEDK